MARLLRSLSSCFDQLLSAAARSMSPICHLAGILWANRGEHEKSLLYDRRCPPPARALLLLLSPIKLLFNCLRRC